MLLEEREVAHKLVKYEYKLIEKKILLQNILVFYKIVLSQLFSLAPTS